MNKIREKNQSGYDAMKAGSKWYVVAATKYYKVGFSKISRKLNAFAPMFRNKKRDWVFSLKPYIFVKITSQEDWFWLFSIENIKFLGYGEPLHIDGALIKGFVDCLNAKKKPASLKKGDSVKVNFGALMGLVGEVTYVSNQKMLIFIGKYGREIAIDPKDQAIFERIG